MTNIKGRLDIQVTHTPVFSLPAVALVLEDPLRLGLLVLSSGWHYLDTVYHSG